MIKLMIVDDHALFREGLASILRLEEDIELAGLAGSVKEAVAFVRELKPEIVLMDFTLPDGNGADATRLILACRNRMKTCLRRYGVGVRDIY